MIELSSVRLNELNKLFNYKIKNNIMKKKDAIALNEQKIYYETNNIKLLINRYTIFFFTYYILSGIYIFLLVYIHFATIKSNILFGLKIGLFIVLILIYPFTINYIVYYMISLYNYFASYFPTNAVPFLSSVPYGI
jgi:hypothetical protein